MSDDGNTVTFAWTVGPMPDHYLAWVHVGKQFVGMLSMDDETSVELHNCIGDGRVVEKDWDHVLV